MLETVVGLRRWLKRVFGPKPQSADSHGSWGCEYCRNPENKLIDGLGADEERMILLLECPRCGQYYCYCGVAPQYYPPLTDAEAAAAFPDAFRSGRPKPD